MFRHGDLLIEQVDDPHMKGLIDRYGLLREEQQSVVLQHGEATGHTHVLTAKEGKVVMVWDYGTQMYVEVPAGGAVLTHEEHNEIHLDEGLHRVTRQREFDYTQPSSSRLIRD